MLIHFKWFSPMNDILLKKCYYLCLISKYSTQKLIQTHVYGEILRNQCNILYLIFLMSGSFLNQMFKMSLPMLKKKERNST